MATDVHGTRDLTMPIPVVFATLHDRSHWERRAALAPEASLRFEGPVAEPDVLGAPLIGEVRAT